MCNSLCMQGFITHFYHSLGWSEDGPVRLLLKMLRSELHPRHTRIVPLVVGTGSEFLENQPGNLVQFRSFWKNK